MKKCGHYGFPDPKTIRFLTTFCPIFGNNQYIGMIWFFNYESNFSTELSSGKNVLTHFFHYEKKYFHQLCERSMPMALLFAKFF